MIFPVLSISYYFKKRSVYLIIIVKMKLYTLGNFFRSYWGHEREATNENG